MKRLAIVFLVCFVSFGAYAQPGPVTATSTATINIVNLLSITSNADPTFTIDTEEEFATGETLTLPGALTITATTDYDITVATSGPDFTSGTDGIPVENVTIDATNGGGTAIGAQPLSETPVSILEEASAGLSQDIDLTYVLAGGDHLLNVPDGSYVTTLTFTLSVD